MALWEVYCDGSATTADKPGGYAYVICKDGVKQSEGSGHLDKATNNVAEITAAICGLKALAALDAYRNPGGEHPNSVQLVSDSQLTLRYATGEYTCRKWHLVPLCIELKKHYQAMGATARWVKGHAGNEQNERCDVLAKAARLLNVSDTLGGLPAVGTQKTEA